MKLFILVTRRTLIAICAISFVTASFSQILIDGANPGRIFEGIGGLSAGASSRLLIDYPEPQRSEVLDYLFKPNFGASLHHLKVEIGGEINSTDGTEPTHMRSRDDLNFTRGYEWWLMKEAKKRNPDIILDCLPWGAPGWIGGGLYHSRDMIDYIIAFIKGAKEAHGLDIEYTGTWNERYYETGWIKQLRKSLDEAGLDHVKLVAADEYRSWTIVDAMVADAELRDAVDIIGSHYSDAVPPAALDMGKPIWASEHGSWTGEWRGSSQIAQFFNRNYINGKITKTINWSLVSAYYHILQLPDSGPMRARHPWSGYYEVQAGIWVVAHTAQFTKPGWIYLEGSASSLLPQGGSIVTLKSPEGDHFTAVAETVRIYEPQSLQFQLTNFPSANIHVWQSTATEQFVKIDTITAANGAFTYTLGADSIYTFTTLTNGHKGQHTPPLSRPFPLPYRDDFEAYPAGATARYLSDQAGTFEVVERADGKGKSLRQVVFHPGIQWNPQFTPYTLMGEPTWRDYEISADVMLETTGEFSILGRIEKAYEPTPFSYIVRFTTEPARCELWANKTLITSTNAPVTTNQWHQTRVQFDGSIIRVFLDNAQILEVSDATYATGLAGFGTGWHPAQFDNFVISPLHGTRNLALDAMSASASSSWMGHIHYPRRAIDGDLETSWIAYDFTNQWLEIVLPEKRAPERVAVWEPEERVGEWRLQADKDGEWVDLVRAGKLVNRRAHAISTPPADRFRFLADHGVGWPIVSEFELFDAGPDRSIRFNEWLPNPRNDAENRLQSSSWFELYNSTTNEVDLSGYFLSGTLTNRGEFRIPEGFRLPAKEHLLVWAVGEEAPNDPDAGQLNANFTLREGQTLSLFDPAGTLVDLVEIFAAEPGISYGSNPDGSLTIGRLARLSPGQSNDSVELFATRASADKLVIQVRGAPFARYRLQRAAGINLAGWEEIESIPADGAGIAEFHRSISSNQLVLYRVVEDQVLFSVDILSR